MRLASRFGYANQIRRDRPLTHEELMHYVPGIFGEDKHTSRSQNYTYIPTITVLESLQRKAFSHSSPARPVCATRAAGDTQNTCCVCGGPER
ncbi:CP4-57 prophage protein [Escherichia coli]|nr:CP4-57 prophage protein [Escherichia coli]